MLKKTFILLSILLLFSATQAQIKIDWRTLSDVTFDDKFFPDEGDYFLFPTFGEKVKALEGRLVYLKGYILAIDPETNYYLLSMNPYAACFFCGAAGPETVVELIFDRPPPPLEMDEVVTMQGKLKLNSDNLYQTNYILEGAELYEP